MRSISQRLAGTFAAFTAALLIASSLSTPAFAAQSGLFGSQDPTYDGVFRQSLAVVALRSHGQPVPASAQSWLMSQQCPDGAFEAFRADTKASCKESDPETYSGKDTNSTAMGAVALFALGKKARALKAVAWLRAAQNNDGGLPWLKGLESDSASTALAMLAQRTVGAKAFVKQGRSMVTYLRTTMLGCDSPTSIRGAMSFQKSSPLVPSDLTTAQAAAALSATFPIIPQPRSSRVSVLPCTKSRPVLSAIGIREALVGYIANRLADNRFIIPSAWGSSADWSSTSWSVLALLGARRGLKEATQAIKQLRLNANTAIRGGDNSVDVGKVALLLLVVRAVNEDPTKFGGVNLLQSLKLSLQ